ncbi:MULTISPECIES: hypothetical protein [Moorena]|uniref:hypothetical protein n=1 Tax=Moorena TaxID=1155738 RepID=UPI001054A765|nr:MULTISPECIES: hypothetical protein [Moorena]NEQ13708.1 hypothetical protein [Moorena sp. SIO3E2]NEP31463.1 hypothetical protein [Moorena sp. SIO3B2]NEQ04603.1 hypothetical protein [Moorena sp. SIO4E2]NER87223.1 hypothetical protein [Moorena sp. SIO3A2]NES40608.1 hypothetical protein [Moorena sp. SIO2C4]
MRFPHLIIKFATGRTSFMHSLPTLKAPLSYGNYRQRRRLAVGHAKGEREQRGFVIFRIDGR